jgi:hypothetical protein
MQTAKKEFESYVPMRDCVRACTKTQHSVQLVLHQEPHTSCTRCHHFADLVDFLFLNRIICLGLYMDDMTLTLLAIHGHIPFLDRFTNKYLDISLPITSSLTLVGRHCLATKFLDPVSSFKFLGEKTR